MTPGNAVLSAIAGSGSMPVPFSFLLDLSLTYLAYQWVKTLGDDNTTISGLHPRSTSLMPLFESQIAALRLQYQTPWSNRHKLTLCAIQLQIYSFAIRTSQSRPGSPDHDIDVDVACNEVRGRATIVIVDLARYVTTETENVYNWPILSRLHLGRAVAIGIYMAATTSDNLTRTIILQACKDIVQMLADYIQYPKEHIARVTKHFAAGIRTIEARGLEWFQTVETADTKPPISARMSANIPYQIVWWAKHSPRILPELGQVASGVPIVAPTQQHNQPDDIQPELQPLASTFDDAIDSSLFDYVNDMNFDFDFTDIHLDWQSLNEDFLQSHGV